MVDWMDELKEDMGREKQRKADAAAEREKIDNKRRLLISLVFSEFDQNLAVTIPAFNQRMYQGQLRAERRYENDTITGDHFIVKLSPLRYMVKLDTTDHTIVARAQPYDGNRWMPASGYAPDLAITTDGLHIFLTKSGRESDGPSPINPADLPQILLSALARAEA